LTEWNAQYRAWKQDNSQPKPTETALRRQLNAIKRTQFPWMLKVTKNAPQMAIIQLGEAFKNFFSGRAKYPQFKKKGKNRKTSCKNSFYSAKHTASINDFFNTPISHDWH
jgi:putative transposase